MKSLLTSCLAFSNFKVENESKESGRNLKRIKQEAMLKEILSKLK